MNLKYHDSEEEKFMEPCSQIKNICIFNSIGEEVFIKTGIDNNTYRLDINFLVTGFYYVEISTSKKTIIKKLLKI